MKKKNEKFSKKKKNYARFHVTSGSLNIKMLSEITKKCIFVTIMQLRVGHGYF